MTGNHQYAKYMGMFATGECTGALLYSVFTDDMPVISDQFVATFAGDTVIIATH